MTGGIANTEKKQLPNWLRIVLIAAGAAIVLAVIVIFSIRSINKAKSGQQQRTGENAAAAEKAMYSEPLMNTGDTDSKRRYGCDVLYAHKNLRILLTHSLIKNTDYPQLEFEMINESKRDYTVELAYITLNNGWFESQMTAEVPSGETVSSKVTVSDSVLNNVKISVIRLAFLITDHKEGTSSYSDPITLRYSNDITDAYWTISGEPTVRLEADSYTLYSAGFDTQVMYKKGVMTKTMFIQNYSESDIKYRIDNVVITDAYGNEIPPEDYTIDYEGIAPGYSLCDRHMTITLTNDVERVEKIKSVKFDFIVSYINDPESAGEEIHRVGFSHELDS